MGSSSVTTPFTTLTRPCFVLSVPSPEIPVESTVTATIWEFVEKAKLEKA